MGPETNASDVRVRFREFAGAERYRQFIRAVNRSCHKKGRLLFWQEHLWVAFTANGIDAPQDIAQVIEAFRVCDIHDCHFEDPPTNAPYPEIRHTPEIDEALENLLPFAGERGPHCKLCRAARDVWIADHSKLCRILRSQTTFEDYWHRLLAEIGEPETSLTEEMQKHRAEISSYMQPGDELWEWDAGGWHCLSGRAGLAIVRNGKAIKRWCDRRS